MIAIIITIKFWITLVPTLILCSMVLYGKWDKVKNFTFKDKKNV